MHANHAPVHTQLLQPFIPCRTALPQALTLLERLTLRNLASDHGLPLPLPAASSC